MNVFRLRGATGSRARVALASVAVWLSVATNDIQPDHNAPQRVRSTIFYPKADLPTQTAPLPKERRMSKRKPFSILKWLIFPSLTLALASTIAWFNLSMFGWKDGAVYIGVV